MSKTINTISLSQELLRCKSITPADDGAMDVVSKQLKDLGFALNMQVFSGDNSHEVRNIYATYGDCDNGNNLCFAGHTDVVPTGDHAKWSVDPFAADIIDDKITARGAVDMKPAIAAWIGAVSQFINENQDFDGGLSLLITGDEEDDRINGTAKMVQYLLSENHKIDACIVGEPTNPSKMGEMIKVGRRGSICFDLTIMGQQGHVAYPDIADNPITTLVNILSQLQEHKLDEGTDFFQPSNLEITSIDVGNKSSNTIPAQASAKFNIRFNDLHSRSSLTKWVEETCNEFAYDKYTITTNIGSEAFITKSDKLSEIVSSSIEEISGCKTEISTSGGVSDACFIKEICSEIVEYGLINQTAHKIDEQVSVEDIISLEKTYKNIIKQYNETRN